MKKYFIGILVGVFITLSGSVFADNIKSLVGSTVDGEFSVKLNGHEFLQKSICIEGSCYMPVRVLSDALGVEVAFDPDEGIELTDERPIPVKTIPPTPAPVSMDLKSKEMELFKRELNFQSVVEVENLSKSIVASLETVQRTIQIHEKSGNVWTDELYTKAKALVIQYQQQLEYLEQLKTKLK